jgi:type II secretory pathway pseudopilin PulG
MKNECFKNENGFTHTHTFLRHFVRGFVTSKKYVCGFTLVETLVAVSIFTVSILSLLVVLSSGISNTGYAKKKMAAAYLAQESIEYIRNMRDTYVLYSGNSQTGWNNFNTKLTSASCDGVNGCYFDNRNVSFADSTLPMTDLLFSACSSAACSGASLLYDASTGTYGYVSGIDSGFVRKIRITQVSANETKVFSTVSWVQGSGTYTINFSESLFNWVE